jgi:hypothetical protein
MSFNKSALLSKANDPAILERTYAAMRNLDGTSVWGS